MIKKRFLLLPVASLLLLGGLLPMAKRGSSIEVEPDNVTYDDNKVAYLDSPHFVSGDGDEDEGEDLPIPEVDKVILHYHNDDGKCGKDTTTAGTAGGRSFYIWVNGVKGTEFFPEKIENDGQDMMLTVDFAQEKFAQYKGKSSLLFIIKFRKESDKNENWGGQSSDTELSFYQFEPDDKKVVEVWTMNSSGSDIGIFKTEAEIRVEGVKVAYFKNWKTIHCKNTATEGATYTLYAYDETYFKINAKIRDDSKKWYAVKTGECAVGEFDIVLPHSAHVNMVYVIESLDKGSTTGLKKSTSVVYDNLYDDARFNQYYTYDGNDLGMTYSSTQTLFKTWAPTAANVTVLLYDVGATSDFGGNNKYKGYHMNYTGHGVWELTIKGDLEGKFYTYQVDNTSGTNETIDPYATACGVNGLRGYVYDKAKTNPEGWDSLPLVWDGNKTYDNMRTAQDLTIYEVHVQDFTGDESWNGQSENGTYNAFVESGTHLSTDATVSTGYDHLDELGIKAVQLLPVFDHDNDETKRGDYNWGYNPLNYNCVEGAYSSDPTDPVARIKEFKNLVLQMSKTKVHTRVIMDVVYNHVSRLSASCFNRMMPKYYFRYNEDGTPADGSGCSNEVRTEATMMRKYIVDSVCMWAKEYKIKGFRFDLMGLIDVKTMQGVKESLYNIDKDIVVYGEPWTSFEGYHGKGVAGADYKGVAQDLNDATTPGYVGGFNDKGRDNLRGGNDGGWGSTNALPGWGFLQRGDDCSEENRNEVANMIWGINSNGIGNPKQSINYGSCHDNWTMLDQLYYTLGDSGAGKAPSWETVIKTSIVGHSLIMASNGVAFMLGGEEIYRTKELSAADREEVTSATYENMYGRYVSHNSYNAPLTTNSFKWGNKAKAFGVNTKGYFESWKAMINLHHTMAKFDYPVPKSTTTSGSPIDNISWAGHSMSQDFTAVYNGAAGFQLDDYFIFAAGRQWGNVGSDAKSWTKLYDFGEWKHGDYGGIDLGNIDNNTGAAIVIFKR